MDHSTTEEGPGATTGQNTKHAVPPWNDGDYPRHPINNDENAYPSITFPSTTTTSEPRASSYGLHHHDVAANTGDAPHLQRESMTTGSWTPLEAGLRVQTDFAPQRFSAGAGSMNASARDARTATGFLNRTPSVKATLSASSSVVGSLSPASAVSSPAFGPMADITPLPSPLTTTDASAPWKKVSHRPESRGSSLISPTNAGRPHESSLSAGTSPPKRKPYSGLKPASNEGHDKLRQAQEINEASHSRNRSISEFVPDALQISRQRNVTVAGLGGPTHPTAHAATDTHMKREEYLGRQRGVSDAAKPPTPPSSNLGTESSDGESSHQRNADMSSTMAQKPSDQYFTANRIKDNTRRSWRSLRRLGQGTFSKVFLATSQDVDGTIIGAFPTQKSGRFLNEADLELDPRKLAAVKLVVFGPAGGASEERIEVSLRRELDILKSVRHPSLVHLKAFSVETTRALLVLTYCPGGDMFEVASQKLDLLVPSLIRRIFAELVAATRYLHERMIVHRDIKLENVLLHLPCERLSEVKDWQTYPYAVVMLTDLGLSRRIDPNDPELHTRCGSEDYASPELLMGLPYDGRQTDAWALGVLLYALMEGRLPFDPLPGVSEQQRARSRAVHRIARCEWSWFRYADDEGDPGDFGELAGAQVIVEGLLKRAARRFDLEKVAKEQWVKDGVQVEGGVEFGDEP